MGCSSSLAVDTTATRPMEPAAAIDLLFDAYGKPTEQVGYTDGHYCLTTEDRTEAHNCGASLLYGEILSSGVSKLLDMDHLAAARASVLFDLGMGVGKLVLQAFLQFPSLKYVYGVELAYSRYNIAEDAVTRLAALQPTQFEIDARVPGEFIRMTTVARKRRRVLELRRCNMWATRGLENADVIVCHTELTAASASHFHKMIECLKPGARFVTYQDVSRHWEHPPFAQLPANVSEEDQFATSWSAQRGHHLYCWQKLGAVLEDQECKDMFST